MDINEFIFDARSDGFDHRSRTEIEFIDNMPPSGTINGHEYIDLGLSVKWATCNVGAHTPSDYGDYYAWGEIATKEIYAGNCVLDDEHIHSIAGNPQYDAARANWGGTWRLPTLDEIEELRTRCSHEWVGRGIHCGYKVIGPNGNYIFLPAAGYWRNKKVVRADQFGNYWIAEPDKGCKTLINTLAFSGGSSNMNKFGKFSMPCAYGQSIRPVTE